MPVNFINYSFARPNIGGVIPGEMGDLHLHGDLLGNLLSTPFKAIGRLFVRMGRSVRGHIPNPFRRNTPPAAHLGTTRVVTVATGSDHLYENGQHTPPTTTNSITLSSELVDAAPIIEPSSSSATSIAVTSVKNQSKSFSETATHSAAASSSSLASRESPGSALEMRIIDSNGNPLTIPTPKIELDGNSICDTGYHKYFCLKKVEFNLKKSRPICSITFANNKRLSFPLNRREIAMLSSLQNRSPLDLLVSIVYPKMSPELTDKIIHSIAKPLYKQIVSDYIQKMKEARSQKNAIEMQYLTKAFKIRCELFPEIRNEYKKSIEALKKKRAATSTASSHASITSYML